MTPTAIIVIIIIASAIVAASYIATITRTFIIAALG